MAGVKGKSGGARADAGREAFKATDEQRDLVQQLASFGLRQSEIVLFIKKKDGTSISEPTLLKNFKDELDTGRIKATVKVAQTLYKKAIGGDTTSMIFWLKAQAGWKDAQRVELTGAGGSAIKTEASVSDLTDAQLAAELAKYGIKS